LGDTGCVFPLSLTQAPPTSYLASTPVPNILPLPPQGSKHPPSHPGGAGPLSKLGSNLLQSGPDRSSVLGGQLEKGGRWDPHLARKNYIPTGCKEPSASGTRLRPKGGGKSIVALRSDVLPLKAMIWPRP
jgi:hypothetical protein